MGARTTTEAAPTGAASAVARDARGARMTIATRDLKVGDTVVAPASCWFDGEPVQVSYIKRWDGGDVEIGMTDGEFHDRVLAMPSDPWVQP